MGLTFLTATAFGQNKASPKNAYFDLRCDDKGGVLNATYYSPVDTNKQNFIMIKDDTSFLEEDGTWSDGVSYHFADSRDVSRMSVKDSALAKNVNGVMKISEKYCKLHPGAREIDDILTELVKADFHQIHKVLLKQLTQENELNDNIKREFERVRFMKDKENLKTEVALVDCKDGEVMSVDFYLPPLGSEMPQFKRDMIIIGDHEHDMSNMGRSVDYHVGGGRKTSGSAKIPVADPEVREDVKTIWEVATAVCNKHPDGTMVENQVVTELMSENFHHLRGVMVEKMTKLNKVEFGNLEFDK